MVGRDRRNDLPGGTVTLLFTDVESSTRTLRALGADYAPALALHRRVIRSACAANGGVEVDTQGDAFLIAFPRAGQGVAAAIAAQQGLAAASWPPGGALRVRMGLHTGEPGLHEEGYVGVDVHLAARICAIASGGQVLASRATAELAGEPPPGGVFRDLGDHRLKDFEQPQRLVQVGAPGLEVDHPPLRSATGSGLPTVSNRLVGRSDELAALHDLVARSDVRLVTLTGAGGAGKSRLALELAWQSLDRVDDGVVLVRLAPITDPGRVPTAIAEALGARDDGEQTTIEAIVSRLDDRRTLLVLDNVEHVLGASPSIGLLLAASSGLTILATGRSPLGLSGEYVVALDPLPQEHAVELFVERARAADHRFDVAADRDAVDEICRRLDGLPLAIELAAARVRLLPPAALLQRLDLALLSGGPADRPERQRTLQATIAWSYGLLTPRQRQLHADLAVFAGGCSLEAVEATCPALETGSLLEDLATLVSGSLLRIADDEEPRYRMLEVVRQYALAELAGRGREEQQRERHAHWVAALAAESESALLGATQSRRLELLDRELPNIRAALDWCRDTDRAELTLRIVTSLGRFWRAHGHAREARLRLEHALTASTAAPELRATGLWWSGHLAMAQGDVSGARAPLEESLSLFRELDSRRETAFALAELGLVAVAAGDHSLAERRCTEALAVAREADDVRALSGALGQLAHVRSVRGDHAAARELLEEALELRRQLGDPLLVANSANNLGVAALAEGDLERARSALGEALEISVELGNAIHIAGAHCALGEIALLDGDRGGAAGHLTQALELYVRLDDTRDAADCVSGLATIAAGLGDTRTAARLWGCADALRSGAASGITATLEQNARPAVAEELGPLTYERETRAGSRLLLADVTAEVASHVAEGDFGATNLTRV